MNDPKSSLEPANLGVEGIGVKDVGFAQFSSPKKRNGGTSFGTDGCDEITFSLCQILRMLHVKAKLRRLKNHAKNQSANSGHNVQAQSGKRVPTQSGPRVPTQSFDLCNYVAYDIGKDLGLVVLAVVQVVHVSYFWTLDMYNLVFCRA